MVKGHRTRVHDSDLHVPKAQPDGTEASENESVMSGDHTLHQRSWEEYDSPQEVRLPYIM